MNVTLSDKHILVTGGTSALGRVFVARAAREGATVYFTYLTNIEEANRLKALGAKGFQINLTDHKAIDGLKKEISTHTKSLDAVVHNAAIVRDRTIQNMTVEEWDEVLNVNLNAVYYLTKRFLSFLFRKKKRGQVAGAKQYDLSPNSWEKGTGHTINPGDLSPFSPKILNIVSRVGLKGGFGEANYAVAKAGVLALTKSLARELGKKQILVNALNPGFMKSNMTKNIPEDAFQRNVDESPLKSISDPEVVSGFMVYLLSDQFRGVTGQVFHLDSRGISL